MLLRRFLCALAIVLCSAQVHAFLREVDPGAEIKLADHEGLLLVSVDTLDALHYVRVQREGNFLAYGKLEDLKAGVSTKLYAVAAGSYRWDRVALTANLYFGLSDDAEFKFEVKAGVINYPGDLLYRSMSHSSARMRATDRALRAIDWLEANFPNLSRYQFFYTGHYPDPFPEFYRNARAAHADRTLADIRHVEDLPKAETPPLPIQELWGSSRIATLALDPGGNLLAEAIHENGKWGIDLFDLQAGEARRLVNPPIAVESMRWFDNRTLVVSLGTLSGQTFSSIFQIDRSGQKGLTVNTFTIPFNGSLVPSVAVDSTQLLLASPSPHGASMVNRFDISNEAAVKHSRHDYDSRLNKGLKDDFAWFADASGQVRLALAWVDGQVGLFYGKDGVYRELVRYQKSDNLGFLPYGMSAHGDLIYGTSDQGGGQRDVVVFDPLGKSISKTLYSKPGVDPEAILFSRVGEPIGAMYFEAGHLVSNYFDEANRHLNELIEKAFPDRTVLVLTRDDAGKVAIVGVDGTDYPFAVYKLDVQSHTASLIDEGHPALAKRKWAPSVVVRTKGTDGLPIEAYLTLPTGVNKPPLVLLAHGGPIGVRDERHFDPEVQFLAALGYAVLQVNFRGSEGYGKAYQQAGEGSLGTLIEDDIDSALAVALAKYPIDAKRMCTMGTSYGGYSALMSAIRHPDRFRCVVDISGVADMMLWFTASDSAYAASGRKVLEKYVGDPRTHLQDIERISPVYRADELKAAVLIVHGTEDERVDQENPRRLVRMLNLAGHTPSMLSFEDEGHGVRKFKNLETAYPAIAAFLAQHLKGD